MNNHTNKFIASILKQLDKHFPDFELQTISVFIGSWVTVELTSIFGYKSELVFDLDFDTDEDAMRWMADGRRNWRAIKAELTKVLDAPIELTPEVEARLEELGAALENRVAPTQPIQTAPTEEQPESPTSVETRRTLSDDTLIFLTHISLPTQLRTEAIQLFGLDKYATTSEIRGALADQTRHAEYQLVLIDELIEKIEAYHRDMTASSPF